MERGRQDREACDARSLQQDVICSGQQQDRLCIQPELPASGPVDGQPDPYQQQAAHMDLLNMNVCADAVYKGSLSCCFAAPVTFTPGAADQMPLDWPPDAESCCGDGSAELYSRIVEVDGLTEAAGMVTVGLHRPRSIADESCAAPDDTQQISDHSGGQRKRQRLCSCTSGQSTGHLSSEDVLLMGDDFECMDSEEASKLLDDANIEYPGGVDAALADMYAACSGEQPLSASAGPAFGGSTAIMGHLIDSSKPAAAQAPAGVGCYYQHQYQHQHGLTVPSLGAVVQTPTPPPCYAPNIMLPCCQWSAFSNDPVGAVLAGREPAAKYLAPRASCCSSAGLTDCLMNLGPA